MTNKKDNDKPVVKRRKFNESETEIKKSDSLKIKINPQRLKIIGITLLLVIIAFLLFSKLRHTDKFIAARVNGEEITNLYIEEQYNQFPDYYKSMITKETILNQSINELLLLQEAGKQGITVKNEEVSEVIKELMESSGLSEDEFMQTIEEQNMTMDYVEDYYRKLLIINKLLNETVVGKVSVSDEETAQYYENNKDAFIVPEQVNASHILVNTSEEAEEILKLLEEGADFAELAKERSKCTSAAKGGNLGYFTRGMMVKEFEDAAFSLDVGELSDIVESSFGYHIIKLHEKKPETTMSLEDASSIIRETIKLEKQNDELAEYLDELWNKAEIQIFYEFKE